MPTALPFYQPSLAGGGTDAATIARGRLALARQRAGVTTSLADRSCRGYATVNS